MQSALVHRDQPQLCNMGVVVFLGMAFHGLLWQAFILRVVICGFNRIPPTKVGHSMAQWYAT